MSLTGCLWEKFWALPLIAETSNVPELLSNILAGLLETGPRLIHRKLSQPMC